MKFAWRQWQLDLFSRMADQGSIAKATMPLRAWREKRFASQYCGKLCTLFVRQREMHAEMHGKALYAQIVQVDLGVEAEAAREIVDTAAVSYASWPTWRPVTFRDVAHYLVMMRLTAKQEWIESEIRRSVHEHVPSQW